MPSLVPPFIIDSVRHFLLNILYNNELDNAFLLHLNIYSSGWLDFLRPSLSLQPSLTWISLCNLEWT